MFINPETRITVLSLSAFVMATVALVASLRSADDEALLSLEARVATIEAETAALKDRAAAEGTMPVKDLFSIASLEAQLKSLRSDMERIKGQTHGNTGESGGEIAQVEQRQERVLREASKAFQRTWKGAFEGALLQNGFDEDARRRIGGDYDRLLGEIEEIQVRWFRGEIDWNKALDEIKMRSTEFYDTVERNYGTDTARRVLDIAFPTPDMKRFFFSGSGQ